MEILSSYEDVFGWITMFFSFAMVVIGLPVQIWKNKKEKTCGITILIVAGALCIHSSRMLYALSISSWYLLIPDSVGVTLSIILFRQWYVYVYRERKSKKSPG